MYDEKPGLYLRDCMDAMREFPDKFFDLAIVDPPYGISQHKRMNGAMPSKGWNGTVGRLRVNGGAGRLKNIPFVQANMEWDKRPPDKEYFDELFRVSKNQIIWGGNYFPLPPTRCVVVWDKNSIGRISARWKSPGRALTNRQKYGGRATRRTAKYTQRRNRWICIYICCKHLRRTVTESWTRIAGAPAA